MDRAQKREVVATLLRVGRRDLAESFLSSRPSVSVPPELKRYADMAEPFGGTLFAHTADRVYYWFGSEKEREQFRRKHKRHFEDQTLYWADRRFHDLKAAQTLTKPMTDHLLWGYTAEAWTEMLIGDARKFEKHAPLQAAVVEQVIKKLGRAKVTADAPAMPFKVGDEVLFGKYKNKRGRIVSFGRNPKGQVTVQIDPIPKGRKKTKDMGLFKIWTTPDAIEAVTAATKPDPKTIKRVARMTKEEFLREMPKGFSYDESAWYAGRRMSRDEIRLGPSFFSLKGNRLGLLFHELGHDLAANNFNRDFAPLMEFLRKDKGPLNARSQYENPFGLEENPEEVIADIYSIMITSPKALAFYESRRSDGAQYKALFDAIRAKAKGRGLPSTAIASVTA